MRRRDRVAALLRDPTKGKGGLLARTHFVMRVAPDDLEQGSLWVSPHAHQVPLAPEETAPAHETDLAVQAVMANN